MKNLFTTATPRSVATFSRASAASNPDGSVAAVNQARYDAGRADGRAAMVEEATTNLLAATITTYNDFPTELTVTTPAMAETLFGQPIVRKTYQPLTTAERARIRTAYASHGVYNASYTYVANTVYVASIFWRCSKPGVLVQGSPANLAGWGGYYTTALPNGWNRSVAIWTGTTGGSETKFWGFKDSIIEVNEVLTIDWACPQLEQKTYATSYIAATRSAEFYSLASTGIIVDAAPFTIEAGIKLAHLPPSSAVATIVSDWGKFYLVVGPDGAVVISWIDTTQSIIRGGILTPGAWNHIAMVFTGSAVVGYLNGVQVCTADTTLPTATSGALKIGTLDKGHFLNGLINDIRFSSTARTAAEIAAAAAGAPLLLDSAATALFAVPDITGEALLLQPANTVTFNAPPLRGDGEAPRIFQPTGRDSGGNLYAYLKANFFRQARKLTFARLTDDILSALRTFDSNVAHGAKNPFAWYDHTGALHTARLTSAISSQQIGYNQHKTEMSLEEDANLPIPAVANWDTAKNSKTGAAPVWILRLTINGVNYYLSGYAFTIAATSIVTTPGWPANVSVTTLPWIGAWGRITTQISGDLNEYSVSDFDCDILVDPAASPNIATLCKSYPVEQSPAELYLWFHGLNPATDPPRLMMRGYVDEVSRLTSKQASIVIKDESARLAAYIGAKIDLTTYPDADPDDVGKVIPIVFGTVSKAPSRCVVSGFVTTITANINADATSITVTAADQISTNTSWLIDNEEVRVTGKSGNTLTVTRGYNSTTAVGHNKAAAFREKMTAALVYLLADHPVTSIGTVYARVNGLDIDVSSACAKYTGNTGSQHTTYPNKAVVTIPDTIAFAKAVLMAPVDGISLTGGTHTHTGIFSGADGDPDLPRRATQVVNGTPVSLYLNETLPTTGAGSRTKTTWTVNANLTGDRKAIGLGNSTGVQVWVYTSDTWPDGAFAWTGSFTDSKKDYDRIYVGVETISSGRYYTMVVEWLNVTRNVEYTGESSSSTVSKDGTVVLSGNSVADTIIGGTLMADIVSPTTTPLACAQFLLNLTPLSAYTIQQVGTFPSFYKFNGVIDRYETALYWLSYLAFQARAWFRIDAGVARLIFRPDPGTLTIAKTIAACKVSSDHTPTVSQSKVDYAKVINKLNLLCDRDWTVDRGDKAYKQVYKASRQSSIDIHGTKENPDLFRFDFITDIYMAGVVGSFYLDTYGARRWQSDFESFLDNCELSFSQGIQMTFAGGAQAEITGMEFAPGSTGEIDAIKIIGEGTI